MSGMQRVAIVTGAGGGIGQAMVEALLATGHHVAAVDRDVVRLAALTDHARRQQRQAALLTIHADLGIEAAAAEIVSATRARFGDVQILVNNAGIGPASIRPDSWQRPLKFWEVTTAQWLPFLAVHATAPLALARALVPDMMRSGWGRIVNVTTSLGTMVRAGHAPYGASKAALEALSAIMAGDLAGTGVTVNVLVPGGVTNTFMVSDQSGFDREQMLQPAIMVPPLLWLVSDAASNVSGRRFLAAHWDPALPPEAAAENAGAPVAWTGIATMPIEPPRAGG